MKRRNHNNEIQTANLPGLKVLVADGLAFRRDLILDMLERMGVNRIITANNGSEAWFKLTREGADMVIAGLKMPEMTGMALLKVIRSHTEHYFTPVVLVTDSIDKGQVIEAGEAGVSDIILEPLSLDAFRKRMESILASDYEPRFQRARELMKQGAEYMGQGKWDKALGSFRKVLSVHENAEVYYNLGYIHTAQGDYEEAIRFFSRATSIKRDFAQAYQKMGECHLRLKQKEKAESCFQKAADIYMDKQMDDNAERMLKEILEINPRIINVYNSLGIIYRRQHKYDKAVAQYKKALKVSPNDESILYNLGRIYFETDHLGQAEEAITKALEQSPQFGEAKEMLRQIKKRRGVKGRKSSSSAGNGKLVLASRQHGDIKAN